MEIKGCTAVVAGGASGLGEATVRSLVNDGAKVAIFDFDETRGSQIAAEIGDAVIFCRSDVTDEKLVQQAIEKTMESFGAVHIAVNCAGVATPAKILSKRGPISIEEFNRVVQINLVGTLIVIKLAAEKWSIILPTRMAKRESLLIPPQWRPLMDKSARPLTVLPRRGLWE